MGSALGDQLGYGSQNLGDAGLVVGAQQGGAVGGDQRFALQAGQMGEVFDAQHTAAAQLHIVAVKVFDDAGVDVLAAEIGGGIHVGDQAQSGGVLAAGGGVQPAVDIALVRQGDVPQADGAHVLGHDFGDVPLQRVGGVVLAVHGGDGVDLDVFYKQVLYIHGVLSFPFGRVALICFQYTISVIKDSSFFALFRRKERGIVLY